MRAAARHLLAGAGALVVLNIGLFAIYRGAFQSRFNDDGVVLQFIFLAMLVAAGVALIQVTLPAKA